MEKSYDIQPMLCMACLCVGRSLQELKDGRIKQYYLDTLNEIPLCNKPTIVPLICWECVALLKKVVSFREQVKDSYRILQTYTHENLYECLLSDVSRPPRLKVHVNETVVISAHSSCEGARDSFMKEEVKVELHDVSEKDHNGVENGDRGTEDEIENLLNEGSKRERNKTKQNLHQCLRSDISRPPRLKVPVNETLISTSFSSGDDKRQKVMKEEVKVEWCGVSERDNNREVHSPREEHGARDTEDEFDNILKVENGDRVTVGDIDQLMKVAKRERSKRKQRHNGSNLRIERGISRRNDDENTDLDVETNDYLSHTSDMSDEEVSHAKNLLEVKKNTTQRVRRKMKNVKKIVKSLQSMKKVKMTKQRETCNQKILTLELTYEEMLTERENDAKRDSYTKALFKCETCLIGFLYQKSYKSHLAAKHSSSLGDYSCPICKTVTSSVEAFTAHYKRHMRRFECSICRKRTVDLRAMQQHYYSTHEISLKEYKCNLCGQVSNSIDTHRYHKDTHKARVQCDECDKTFSHRAGLMNHRLAVHESKNEFPCTVCDKVFRWKTSLKRHLAKHNIKSAAAAGGAYCAECDIGFSSLCSLQRHLRNSLKHVTVDQLKFICDHCKRRFADKTKLRDHIEEKHLHRTYQCHICQKTSKNRVGLEQHIRNVHKGRPNNKMCHHCGKGFPTKVQLESHIRTHTGERPFICEYCPTTFSQQSNLYKHHRQVHLNIKSKRYPLCNKKRRADGIRTDDPSSGDCANGHLPVVVQYNMAENLFGV